MAQIQSPLKFQSTRSDLASVTFEETLCSSWAKDGGLYMPTHIPVLNQETLRSWRDYTYTDICFEVLKIFLDNEFISDSELRELVAEAHKDFDAEIIPIKRLKNGCNIMELFHGPTYAFKDYALSICGKLINYANKKNKSKCFVTVSTSGDTGSAVIEVTKGCSHIDTFVFFPGGRRLSDFQRLLLSTVDSRNIHAFSGDCFSDNFDYFMPLFVQRLSQEYPKRYVTSLNSLSWSRVMVQIAHFIYGYFQVTTAFEEIDVIIPTGGFGNATSAVCAKKLGFPLNIKPGFNSRNLNSYSFLTGGKLVKGAAVAQSNTTAMDIQYPVNLERLLYLWSDGNVELVKHYMEDFLTRGECQADKALLQKMKEEVEPFCVTDEEILDIMRSVWKEENYLLDPHTAVGLKYVSKFQSSKPNLCVATAGPIKFSEILQKAGVEIPESFNEVLEKMKKQPEHVTELPQDQNQWLEFIMEYMRNKNL